MRIKMWSIIFYTQIIPKDRGKTPLSEEVTILGGSTKQSVVSKWRHLRNILDPDFSSTCSDTAQPRRKQAISSGALMWGLTAFRVSHCQLRGPGHTLNSGASGIPDAKMGSTSTPVSGRKVRVMSRRNLGPCRHSTGSGFHDFPWRSFL